MTQTMTARTLSHLTATQKLPLVAAFAIQFAGLVTEWDERHRTRRHLKALDAHLLQDIGKTPAQAREQAARWFWQL